MGKKAVVVAQEWSDESEESEATTDEESEVDLDEQFDLEERKVHAMCRQLKGDLEDISPGIGDRITLANFVSWVRAHSSALADSS